MKNPLLLLLLLLLPACGASGTSRSPSQYPSKSAAQTAPAQQSGGGYAQPPMGAASAPPPVTSAREPGAPKTAEAGGEMPDEDSRQRELQLSENVILRGGADCVTACKALTSMTRAAGRVCEPPPPATSDATADCRDIGERLRRAKKRVTDACGVCPDSP